MIEVIKREYWSKSEAFLLPLTGLVRTEKFEITTYLFWEDYTIENYQLVVKFNYGHKYEEFREFLHENVFGRKGAFSNESYDYEGFTIMVFDLSEWAFDIEQFLKGKYSKFSKEAKDIIYNYHTYFENGRPKIDITIYGCLYPLSKEECLGGMHSIDYVSTHYGFDRETLTKLGEIGSIYDTMKETLDTISQTDSKMVLE